MVKGELFLPRALTKTLEEPDEHHSAQPSHSSAIRLTYLRDPPPFHSTRTMLTSHRWRSKKTQLLLMADTGGRSSKSGRGHQHCPFVAHTRMADEWQLLPDGASCLEPFQACDVVHKMNTHRLPNEQKSLSFHCRHGTGDKRHGDTGTSLNISTAHFLSTLPLAPAGEL